MKTVFEALVRENPMRIEIARFRRRYLGFQGSGLSNAILALILLCYTGMVMLVVNLRGDMPPVALVMFQTGLFCFFGPAMLHGAIAGERERRSWDLLLVAPITKAQIVAGKFMGAMAALGIGAVAMGLPIVLSAFAYAKTNAYDLLLAELVSLTFCMLVCAWTLFISARVKRPFMALGTSVGTLALALLVVPLLFAALIGGDRFTSESLNFLNPFVALNAIGERAENTYSAQNAMVPFAMYGLTHVFVYTALTACFLVYAEKTLNFPENEIKFLPRGHQDA
jgi:ABC-type transport system involved in multi-copper enzyme maturation permease subunit